MITKKKIIPVLMLISVIAIAGFFRLWRLKTVPPGLFFDEALNGNDALTALENRNFKVFYTDVNGREGLFINLIALSFSLFGPSFWSIRIVSAIFGIVTVFGLYLLIKELFSHLAVKPFIHSTIIALLSSFFLATSFWHINFSRIGFRGIVLPFALVFSFYFLFRGFRERKNLNFIISGIFFGLGFYTYTSYRFILLFWPATLFFWFLVYRKESKEKQFFSFAAYCLICILIVSLPLIVYFSKNPEEIFERATEVSVFSHEHPLGALFNSFFKHLGMFNFRGDSTWRHNFANSPQLFWPVGILFLIGFGFSIKSLILSIKKKDYSKLTVQGFLLSWFFTMLLPGILTHEKIPHALRVIGVIPVVYIFAGIGFSKLYEYFGKKKKYQNLVILVSVVLLLFVGTSQYKKYFIDWAKNPEVELDFSQYQVDIGKYLVSLPKDVQKYVVVNYFFVDPAGNPQPFPPGIPALAHTPIFIERSKEHNDEDYKNQLKEPTIYILLESLYEIEIDGEFSVYKNGKAVIIPLIYNENLLNRLSGMFPEGSIEKENNIWIYKMN